MKKILVSFVGAGGYSNTEYCFPGGKTFTSAVFLNSYLAYSKEEKQKFDALYIIGTVTSDWAILLPEGQQYDDLRNNLREQKNHEEDTSCLESLLSDLSEKLEKLYGFEVNPVPHFSDIEGQVSTIYEAYHDTACKIEESCDNEECEIFLDITHSMRFMPMLFFQALTEGDFSIKHIIYGDVINKRLQDLSECCSISTMNKALNAMKNKFNFEPLSSVLKNVWFEMSTNLHKINIMISNSIMDYSFDLYMEFSRELSRIGEFEFLLNSYEQVKAELESFKMSWSYGFESVSDDEKCLKEVCMLNLSKMFIDNNLLMNSALANDAVLQHLIMGKIYSDSLDVSPYCDDYYSNCNKKDKKYPSNYEIYNFVFNWRMERHKCSGSFKRIHKNRNAFAHNFSKIDASLLEKKKKELKDDEKFLRKVIKKNMGFDQ